MPQDPPRPEPAPADLALCRAMLRHHARSFHAASWLLPRRVRDPASVLYAFCRIADDAVDVPGGRPGAVGRLRTRLDGAYRGQPLDAPVDRALAAVVARHHLPRRLPELLLEGLAWDAEGRRYDTLDQLLDYAARVAGSVGAMMAVLMGERSPVALARACDLGVAMQLTNIARDVDEDAALGRLYLPGDWLREAGTNACVQRLLHEAGRLYVRAAAGIALLPPDCRAGIRAAGLIYAAIGDEVARRRPVPCGLAAGPSQGSPAGRAVVPPHRKAWLLVRALGPPAGPAADALDAPPLPATLSLVQAASQDPAPGPLPGTGFAGVVELFLRLERRDRLPAQLGLR